MTQTNKTKDAVNGYRPDPNARTTMTNTVIALVLGLLVMLGLGFYRYTAAQSSVAPTYISGNPQTETRSNIDTSRRTDIQNTATTPDTESLPRPIQKAIDKAAR